MEGRKEGGKEGRKEVSKKGKREKEKQCDLESQFFRRSSQTMTVLFPVITMVMIIGQIPFTNSVTLFPTGYGKHEKKSKPRRFLLQIC